MSSRSQNKQLKKKRSWFSKGAYDGVFLFIVMMLLTIGLIMLFSSSYVYAYYNRGGNGAYFFTNQLVFAAIGLVAMFFAAKLDYDVLRRFAPLLMFISLGLLVLVLFWHTNVKDFKRWLPIPGFSVQPSEIAKICLVIFLAWSMERRHKEITGKNPSGISGLKRIYCYTTRQDGKKKIVVSPTAKSFLWTVFYALVIAVVCVLVFLEKHLSGTILIFILGVSMMCFGEVPMKWFALGISIVCVAVLAVYIINKEVLMNIFESYMKERIVAWRDKSYDPYGARWQTNQSLNAIGSGGFLGAGIGGSKQKHLYVSEPQNDFIFAIVCEELGFVGAVFIIFLFIALVWRGFVIASRARDQFGALLASGLVMQVGLQAALNIAVVTDTIPNTGIGLPFFSAGGSSLVVLLASMGIVLSVSKYSRIEKLQ